MARASTTSLIAAIVLVAGACSAKPTPDAAVPRLKSTLSRVDASLASGNYTLARTTLTSLIAQTQTALQDGKLSQEQADRIQAAAGRLLSQLPDPPTHTPPSTTPATPPPSKNAPPDDNGD
ncbi:hypothetical protein ACFUC1_17650 [Pedococcus sp. NPDC057267]|uniref:hypothetical protein n=1 Tax=Pedococcus sp. NPDC057267 TaxID=3346077 RepID=UPI00363F242F